MKFVNTFKFLVNLHLLWKKGMCGLKFKKEKYKWKIPYWEGARAKAMANILAQSICFYIVGIS